MAKIVVTPDPADNFVIVEFKKDKARQRFQLWWDDTSLLRIKADNCFIIDVKWKSVVMPDVHGNPTYETQLYKLGHIVPLPDRHCW